MRTDTTPTENNTDNDSVFHIKRVECPECDESFHSQGAGHNHIWASHVDQESIAVTFQCNHCSESFTTQQALADHQENAHLPETFHLTCRNCNDGFATTDAAVEHFWNEHVHETRVTSHIIQCPRDECNWHGNSVSQLLRHTTDTHNIEEAVLSLPNDREPGECPHCDSNLHDDDGMLQHVTAKHSDKITAPRAHQCKECNQQFTDPDVAAAHVRDNHAPNINGITTHDIQCPDCRVSRQSEKHVRNHYTQTHVTYDVCCPECNKTNPTNSVSEIKRHYWETHTPDRSTPDTEVHATIPREETLECLYNINKHAKKYKKLGTENYRKGKKTTAKANSLKKQALYAIKEQVLQQLHHEADDIRIHVIDGSEFYLLDFTDWSFHSPRNTLSVPETDISMRVELNEFVSDAEKEHSNKSLKECLLFFRDEFGLNANNELKRTYLSYGHNSYFIGWEYL